jgi:hypothetical protein
MDVELNNYRTEEKAWTKGNKYHFNCLIYNTVTMFEKGFELTQLKWNNISKISLECQN